ncbi:hypothetical protein [Oceanobacillus chungangensis]|uniref:Sublancin immunity protein SunI-like PH domain-containing protein n=1 Tax=Oceanobacillus chungangensis TaxID=1229152 RepID=A0A3D8PQ42_9BACI|nr:hypothetical protein [Oceanobacillus chungangensis]RDW17319.1 hypothetical protein CWR45_13085 [Oceanobacillus chungangensis]
MEIKVYRKNESLYIKWLLSKFEIKLSDITGVLNDDTYSGDEKSAIRIGFPYGNTDRVVIKTKTESYIIYSSIDGLKEKILSYLN